MFLKLTIMLATIKIDGKDHLAVVFDEKFSYGTLAETKKALVELVGYLETEEESESLCYSKARVLCLAKEMCLTQDQTQGMMSAYFNKNTEDISVCAETKMCEITY